VETGFATFRGVIVDGYRFDPSCELRIINEVLDEGDDAASELRCQLDERKCDGAPENNIEYYIDECSHVNVSRRDAHHIQP